MQAIISHNDTVTTPWKMIQFLDGGDDVCSYGVQMDIANKYEKVGVFITKD